MHHPEQPALARVGDAGIRREGAAGGRADVAGLADIQIHVVGDGLVVDEHVDDVVERGAGVQIQFVASRAEAGAPQQVFDLTVRSPGHVWRS